MISPHLWTARLKKPSPQNTPTWTAESYSHDLRKKVFRWEFRPWLFVIPKSLLLWNTLVLSTHGGFCKNLALRVVCQHWGLEKIHLKHRNNSSELEKHLPTAWGDQWQSSREGARDARLLSAQTISRLQLGFERGLTKPRWSRATSESAGKTNTGLEENKKLPRPPHHWGWVPYLPHENKRRAWSQSWLLRG